MLRGSLYVCRCGIPLQALLACLVTIYRMSHVLRHICACMCAHMHACTHACAFMHMCTYMILYIRSYVCCVGSSAFIMYSKEENDPHGDQVLCLSNLLNNYGINCDIDLYHLTDAINDWSFWVGKNLEYCNASEHSHVILVCSPTMIATLEERSDNACVQMVGGYIDRLTLRHYLQQGAHRVLPLFINKSSADYVPPSLSGKTWYQFPYNILAEMPENVSPLQVLEHPSFTSLRSLVATLTGQPEHVPPGELHDIKCGSYFTPPVYNCVNDYNYEHSSLFYTTS